MGDGATEIFTCPQELYGRWVSVNKSDTGYLTENLQLQEVRVFGGKLPMHDDVIKWKHFFALLALCEGNPPVGPRSFPLTKASDAGL